LAERFRFCPHCAHELEERAGEPDGHARPTCPQCGFVYYQNPKPCAGALVVQDGRVLLGRRSREPFKGYWDIPGGFMEGDEHPWETAAREVKEETGLVIRPVELLGMYPDVYGESDEYTLNIFYIAEVAGGEPRPADDVEELGWFAGDELPEKIAFANGRQALEDWRRRRRAILTAISPPGWSPAL
jgi:8-oxo-dGTP diphosphatase